MLEHHHEEEQVAMLQAQTPAASNRLQTARLRPRHMALAGRVICALQHNMHALHTVGTVTRCGTLGWRIVMVS